MTQLGLAFTQVLPAMLLLLGIALIVSVIGFYRVVYFISIGYAFSIVAMAIVTTIVLRQNLTWASVLQNLILGLWGLRLGIYLVRRESRRAYRRQLEESHQRAAGMGLTRKLLIWIGVSILYVCMFSPSLFGLIARTADPTWLRFLTQLVGLLIMAGGLALEALADAQKSRFKARFPKQFCKKGLYRWVRCPNYLGEILVWVGSWIVGLTFYTSILKWVSSLVGLVCIVLIMMGSTKRLERTQGERYGELSEYQEYVRTVPVLIPFVPVYTLKNVRVYLE